MEKDGVEIHKRVVPSGQDSSLARSGSQSHRRILFPLPAHGATHNIKRVDDLENLSQENKTVASQIIGDQALGTRVCLKRQRLAAAFFLK